MATHRSKRTFQPPITSFFASADRDTLNYSASYDRPGPLTPPVPNHIQSSLLNVGMRVRKSVPEGYKTHKTAKHAFSSAPERVMIQPTMACEHSSTSTESFSGSSGTRAAGLLPFCGLHRVGGHSAQPSTASFNYSSPYGTSPFDSRNTSSASVPVNATAALWPTDPCLLPWSQSSSTSIISTSSQPPNPMSNSQKRSYEESAEDEIDAAFLEDPDAGTPTVLRSPRPGYPISHTAYPNLSSASAGFARPLARMKTRRKVEWEGRSERKHRPTGEEVCDFEEAGLLIPMEIEMGGV
ncbi:hypothetical protein LTR16_005289 [Cryomyces antarcticus]|uniref:Uncharacterized protein n=1 Tax=Cryomyces antarcticus TaxID=329879 RepID=A0ABR0LWS8_9PEZI|nr:hypothetical protein LTR16_005289 [Cryomyces antarcticus]